MGRAGRGHLEDGYAHLLDKPWSTIDPSNHKRMFVSYTDFDFSQTNDCGTNFPGRTAIEFVESDDGGVTWSSTPTVAIEVCGNAAVQGSQLAVSSTGTLYISWVNLGSNFPLGPRCIQVASYAKGNPVRTGDGGWLDSAGRRFLLPAG